MKKAIHPSPAHSLNADALRHIRAEAVRHLERTGAVITEDEALALIVQEHAELHRLIVDCLSDVAPHVDGVGALTHAIAEDALRLVDAEEDTSHVQFRVGVLAALQDPATCQSVAALHSRIGALGIAPGWCKVKQAA